LIVRRVRDANPDHVVPDAQGELFPAWRHHAVFTDSPLTMLKAEADHRRHAVVEQVIADHPGYARWVPRAVVVGTRWARTYRASASQDNSGQHGGTSLTSANSIGRQPTTFLNTHKVALAVWGSGVRVPSAPPT
jgi:hypothetical protein